ncbi:MAG: hypothetical protein ACFFD9_00625 [Candidatus Thorarchaeota archaeon]
MTKVDIHTLLKGKWEDGTRPKDLYASHISANPLDYLEDILQGLSSEERRVQSGCAEVASLLSEDKPELLYPSIELFVDNLDAKAPVLRWEAVCALGNLASVDTDGRLPALVDKMTSFLQDKSIVLQGHTVRALSKVVRAYPKTAPRIIDELLSSVELFPGNRVGFLVEAMASFVEDVDLLPRARSFVQSYIESDIRSVASKAKKVMKMM